MRVVFRPVRRPPLLSQALGAFFVPLLVSGLLAADTDHLRPATAAVNGMVQVTFTARKHHADPFNDIELNVVFMTPKGAARRVPAFWAGGQTWRVRYSSALPGSHRFRTECSDTTDDGLHKVTGTVEIVPYHGHNPLYQHGPIRVAGDHRHFEYSDHTPFFWLADTWWMGLCNRLQWPKEFQALVADRREKGFNVVQIVAGLYPDMSAFDPRGRNEAGFPWEADYQRIRPEYFDRADDRLLYLVDQGMMPCIVGAWGYHLPWLGVDRMKKHWRYLIARYGALPVVWCVAGEINLPYYLDKGFPRGGEKQTAAWEDVIRYVRQVDPFTRLITAHPTGIPPLSARALYQDQTLFDFDMLQTGHGGLEVLGPSIRTLRKSYGSRPAMPVINGEVAYEALSGGIPARVPRTIFWASMMSGAAGHSYGANGIWQLNRRERAYGKSPHGGTYGVIPWDEAMNLPGSRQLGFAKRLLEAYPWQRFVPHPEWASWQDSPAPAGNEFLVPYASGIPGVVRLVYLPHAQAVTVCELESVTAYVASVFNPVTGRRTTIGPVQADPKGRWTAHPPRELTMDWVLILDTREHGP